MWHVTLINDTGTFLFILICVFLLSKMTYTTSWLSWFVFCTSNMCVECLKTSTQGGKMPLTSKPCSNLHLYGHLEPSSCLCQMWTQTTISLISKLLRCRRQCSKVWDVIWFFFVVLYLLLTRCVLSKLCCNSISMMKHHQNPNLKLELPSFTYGCRKCMIVEAWT